MTPSAGGPHCGDIVLSRESAESCAASGRSGQRRFTPGAFLSYPWFMLLGMDQNRRARLVTIMRHLAEGDAASIWMFYEEFGRDVLGAVRAQAAARRFALSADDLDAVTLDACLAIAEEACAWRHDAGALPWVWAGRRIAAIVNDHIGMHTRILDDSATEIVGGAATLDDRDAIALLEALAGRNPLCLVLRQALSLVASPVNQALLLEYQTQLAQGDGAPSHTIAERYGLTPSAVRKRVQRTRERLRVAAAGDPALRAVGELALVCP